MYSVQENNGVPSLQNPSCNIDVVPAVPEYSSNTNASADIYTVYELTASQKQFGGNKLGQLALY